MTQFSKKNHRAKTRLEIASPRFSWMFKACEKARINGVSWPQHVFCVTDVVKQLAVHELENAGVLKQFLSLTLDEQIGMFATALMWASWRTTQGIYRFDETVYKAVISTEKTNKIPCEVLRRLPEWCVYVETPGLTCDFGTGETQLNGVWACFAMNYNRELLMIYADVEGEQFDEIIPPTVHIDTSSKTVEEGIKIIMAESGNQNDILASTIENWLLPVINLLLYLCADREITHKNKLEEPQNPTPKKTKKGWRLFPAHGIKKWDVGVRMGSALNIAQTKDIESENNETGRKVRAHIRRAHWHTIVSGKMKDKRGHVIPANQRKRKLKWMPPCAVNLTDIELPAVIRSVK